jgi:glycine cleavage system T protein
MQETAKVVIIGAGIVGCSAAYHLTKLGWRDIVIVDQGPLFDTGGSTSASPGLIFQTNSSRLIAKLAQYTVNLFQQLELNGQPSYYRVGGMEVAYTPERMEELKRRVGFAKSWGIEGELITPEEAKNKIPLLDQNKILGAYYVSTDGAAVPIRAAEALAREAEKRGAVFYGHTLITGIETEGGKVKAVNTKRGRISTDVVLLCAGIWGPSVASVVNVPIPLIPMQHQHARTKPLPELAGETREIVHPILRHQDKSMYFRQRGSCYEIGSYLHEPMPLDPYMPDLSSVMRFTEGDFERAAEAAVELLPPIGNVKLGERMNGVFSFTPDAMPLIGPSLDLKGFWIAEAVWVAHSGGVGKAIAEWMVDGVPSLDLRECDINRFHEHAFTQNYIRARGIQQYKEVYDIIHPLQQIKYPRNLRLTPFHQRLQDLGGVFFESVGWERPQWFDSNRRLLDGGKWPSRSGWEAQYWSPVQAAEHKATRERVAIYDITPFVKIDVRGPKAFEFMQHLCANQIDQPTGKVVYTSMLNERGGIMCDLTVTRLGENQFLVLTGGTSGMHDLAWMRANAPGDGSVQITDVTSSHCAIGLWGPRAVELAQSVSSNHLSAETFGPFTAKHVTIGSVPALALRVSYVGEMGWEIYTQPSYGLFLWDTLWNAGQSLGLVAAGGGAFDSLRLEKGYRLWGADIYSEHNPYEAGLGFAVKLDKGDFIGRDALLELRDKGVTRKLCRMYFDDPNAVVMGKEPILSDDKVLGYVTSSNTGYTLGESIAYGYLPIDFAKEATPVDIYYFGKRKPAKVVKERR